MKVEIAILHKAEAQKIIEGHLMRLHMAANTSKWRAFERNNPVAASIIKAKS